jgi:PAS domain S-box-containing protein
MSKTARGFTKGPESHRQAEKLLQATQRDVAGMSVNEVQQLAHDLQVHQIELEMQNEELRRAQLELQTVRDRYMELYEFSPSGYLTLDMDSTIVEANLRAGTLLGVTRKKLVGQPLTRFLASDDQDVFHRHCRAILKTGVRQSCEVRLRKTVGATDWIHLESLAVGERPGRITHWRTAFLDVSDRRRMEEALRVSEERFRTIMDNSPSMIFLKDTEGRYLQVNRTFEHNFDVAKGDIVGKTDEEIFAPEQAAAFRANDRTVLAAGRPMEYEEEARYRDGGHTSIVVKFPLRNAQGQCYALCGIATDITDRKRAEELHARLAAMVESSTDAIVSLTNGRVSFWNASAERLFGYSSDEILGQPGDILLPPHRRGEIQRLCAAVFAGERIQDFETERLRKDGSLVTVSVTVSAVRDSSGTVHSLFANIRDITERKRTEQRLQDSLDQLRTLSQRLNVVREEERTKIARELHDELGVRLTCLKLDLVRMRSLMEDPTCHCEYIDEKIHSMLTEVDVTISSVQRLVTELRPGVLDDLGLVAAIEWQCQDFERRSGIRCSCEAREGDIQLNGPLATAAFRICQEALVNVARHAKATSIRVLVEQVNGELLLEIQDNGLGIPVEKLTDSSSLGLLGMRERAVGLGGTVTIAGSPWKGTTVTVRVPCSEQADKETS